MPSTVIDNIKGKELPADWRKKINALPNRTYSVIIQPQEERETFLDVVKEIRNKAEKRGMTPEILADILDIDVETVDS